MALWEDGNKGLPLGIGLAILAVSAGPKLIRNGRPLLKRAIKGYLVAQERAKEMMAESAERVQDLYAEAKHEHEEEQATARAESDLMPEPGMIAATKAAEGGARTQSTSQDDYEDVEG